MELIVYGALLVVLGIFVATFGRAFFRGAPYAPTEKTGVDIMIRLAKIKAGERAVDIGSGDGRIVAALARAGARADGVEINPFLVWWSRRKIKQAMLADATRIIRESLWKIDYSPYSVVCLFGIPYIMKGLEKKLTTELPAGARIISNRFAFPGLTPEKKENGIYLYRKR